jgi:hypothetical protein
MTDDRDRREWDDAQPDEPPSEPIPQPWDIDPAYASELDVQPDQPEQPSQPEPEALDVPEEFWPGSEYQSELDYGPPDQGAFEAPLDALAEGVLAQIADEREAEAPPDAEALRPADADAESDLARAPRVSTYRAQRRTQISMILPALLLLAVGVLYLSEALTPDVEGFAPEAMGAIAVATLGLSMIARFVFNGRRERGLFLAGLLILFWLGLAGLVVTGDLLIGQAWPFAIAAIGLALLAVFVFERSHERGLVLPALAFIVAGIVALPFGLGLVPADVTSALALLWPVLLIVPALGLLPHAFRSRSE